MTRLSVIIITNNEEENLPRCLNSVKFADEIIVNDSGSSDATLAIASEHGCKVIQSRFAGFGVAKQTALAEATGDWVFSIDADEEVDSELRESILQAISDHAATAYEIVRKSQFLGRWMMHSGWYPDRIIRLFRRDSGRFTSAEVHEKIVVDGNVGRLSGHLLHYTDPNLRHYLNKLNHYTTLSAVMLLKEGKKFRVFYLFSKPIALFFKMYFLKQGFRDGLQGLLLALLSSVHVLVKYAKLWELQRQ